MLETLYKKTSKGKIQVWEIEVTDNNGEGHIKITSGQLDGRRTTKERTVVAGKNIGKANQTTPFEQAQKEAQSAWQKKRDKDYHLTIEDAETTVSKLPMLAHKFTERGHDIVYPALVQPKLDGVRCIAARNGNDISFMSRGGKEYSALQDHPELVKALLKYMPDKGTFDGEIYYHGWSLARIVSAVKKVNDDTPILEYWVYDIPSNLGFYERFKSKYKWHGNIPLKYVYSLTAQGKDNVKTMHDNYVSEGYEGIIIRNKLGPYAWGKRSKNLQKYKEFIDDEFEIVGHYSESNEINGTPIESICFKCVTKDGGPFDCRPKGTLKHRAEMWKDRESYVGKMLTVRYQGLTDNSTGNGRKVPQFPIGIAVRDYE